MAQPLALAGQLQAQLECQRVAAEVVLEVGLHAALPPHGTPLSSAVSACRHMHACMHACSLACTLGDRQATGQGEDVAKPTRVQGEASSLRVDLDVQRVSYELGRRAQQGGRLLVVRLAGEAGDQARIVHEGRAAVVVALSQQRKHGLQRA